VPPWVPDDVRYLTGKWVARQSEDLRQVEVVEHLLTDDRMTTVWQQVLRKDRRTDDYEYLSNCMKKKLGSARANELFAASTAVVFQTAAKAVGTAQRFRTHKGMYYLDQEQGRRRDAEFLRRMITERRLENA